VRNQRMAYLIVSGAAALALNSSGCHKRPTGPSAHFARGDAIYQDLYVRELDDAYLDPKMDDAVAELRQVEPDSVSAHLASDLLAQIDNGKTEALAAKDARQKALAASLQRPNIDVNRAITRDSVILSDGAPPAVDAGPAVADPYGPGAPIADINRESGGCLVSADPFREEGSGKSGATYVLAADTTCKAKLPGFIGQTVLAVDGRIYRRVASSEMRADKVLPGSPKFLPDGGVPPATPAGRALGGPTVNATAPLPSNASSLDTNVAAAQDATPRPAPPPSTRGSTQQSDATSTTTNVATQQNATPSAPPVVQPVTPVQDATPPPPQ
jgi:hypothetical protein